MMIRIKTVCLMYFFTCCFITSFSQVNDFVKSLNYTVFASHSTNGWVKFSVIVPYTKENIFTDGKKYFLPDNRFSMKLFKSNKEVNTNGSYKFKEFYKEIEIEGAVYILHTKNGKLESGNGYIYTPAFIKEQKNISEATALQFAIKDMKPADLFWNIAAKEQVIKKRNAIATYYPKAEMRYLVSADQQTLTLCYRFFISTLVQGKLGYYYINAASGKLEKFKTTVTQCDQASVVTTFYGAKAIYTNDVAVFGNSYDLQDDCQGSVYSVYNPVSQIYNTGNNDWNTTPENRSAGTTLYCIKTTYSWYKNVFGRNGHGNNNEDLDLIQNSSFGTPRFGENAAYTFNPVPFSTDYIHIGYGASTTAIEDDYNVLDILAHEFTHGVTHYEANLDYESESGALNESFSDIFGIWVKKKEVGYLYTDSVSWLLGWDRMENGTHVVDRSFKTPQLRNQPDRIDGNSWRPTNVTCTGGADGNDYCGVHYNSGVQNRMFYLLCTGGNGRTNDLTSNANLNDPDNNPYNWSITAIGIDKAIQIAYRVLTDYLGPNSNYTDARNAWVHAAVDLFGECSFEAIQTGMAWDAVGLRAPGSSNVVTNICGVVGGVPTFFTNIGIQNVSSNCFFIVGNAGNLVQVKAGTQVHIYPGFSSTEGSHFRALIDGDCRFASY